LGKLEQRGTAYTHERNYPYFLILKRGVRWKFNKSQMAGKQRIHRRGDDDAKVVS